MEAAVDISNSNSRVYKAHICILNKVSDCFGHSLMLIPENSVLSA